MRSLGFFLVLIMRLTPLSQAEILVLDSMHEVHHTLDRVLVDHPPQTLFCAFDIDMTLTQPSEPAYMMANILKYGAIYRELMGSFSGPQKDLIHKNMLEGAQEIIEPSALDLVHALQEQQVPVIAFTASLSGPVKAYDAFKKKRYETMKTLGFDFSSAFPHHNDFLLQDCSNSSSICPIFYKGILYSNGDYGVLTKGDVLVSFLKTMKVPYRTIVMVDDRKKNLEDIETSLHNHDPKIHFIGLHYKGASKCIVPTISEEQFTEQWKNLIKKTAL